MLLFLGGCLIPWEVISMTSLCSATFLEHSIPAAWTSKHSTIALNFGFHGASAGDDVLPAQGHCRHGGLAKERQVA